MEFYFLETRLQPILREITDNRASTKDELEALYRKIVSSVLLRSGLGSPTGLTVFFNNQLNNLFFFKFHLNNLDISVVREATAALQSVFPQTELGNFLTLSKRDKDRQLIELTQIVTGIRLFNKECGKGGEGIDNLPGREFIKNKTFEHLSFSNIKRSYTSNFERNSTTNRRFS